MKNNIWGTIPVNKNECQKVSFGSKVLYIKRGHNTIKACIETTINNDFERIEIDEGETDHLEFKSFYMNDNNEIGIRQAYLKKPILISLIEKRALMPKESVETFVQLPIAMELLAMKNKESYELLHIPSTFIPDAWFGDENGEPCHLLKSDFISKVDKKKYTPNYVYCPLTLSNSSETVLDLEKFLLRTPHFKLYQNLEGILFSDQIHIKFRGNNQDSIISLSEPEASQLGKLTVISGSSQPYVEQLIKKSFDFIRFIH